ncbi:hypothetical protein BDV96DRAFT_646456 [Lophiotrema nucula]|uniref:Diaminopimelate epimerase-like protein n=1 Tax=Lophiotrema nucula TaxID=690887 RepID=A0A6A5Z7I6_9PLEO|nr:hypothetical protein BDV96DRAFT_646456 [Lophiotrema nucula]
MSAAKEAQVEFITFDVFTSKRYEGNPLAVVKIPNSTSLSQKQKQDIAREFNLSETTFWHQPTGIGELPTWTVDIFMTTKELPFAGHPTIGTACYLLSSIAKERGLTEGIINGQFNIKAGKIDLVYDVASNRARAGIPHDVHVHEKTWSQQDLSNLQPRLAQTSESQGFELKENYPIVSIVKGMTFVLIELSSLEALELVKTTSGSIHVEGLDEGWGPSFIGTYFFVRLAGKTDGTRVIRTRMIEGTMEDSATGSAASDLAAYLSLVEGQAGQTLRYDIVQGVEMGRRSNIGVEVVLAEQSGIAQLYLEGSAVQVMEGKLAL